jgi:hypothetical protein
VSARNKTDHKICGGKFFLDETLALKRYFWALAMVDEVGGCEADAAVALLPDAYTNDDTTEEVFISHDMSKYQKVPLLPSR